MKGGWLPPGVGPCSAVVAVAKMRKVTVFTMREKKDQVLETLRDLEIMEVRETSETREQAKIETPPEVLSKLSRLSYITSYLLPYNPVKKSFVDMFTGKKPDLSLEEFHRVVNEYDVDDVFQRAKANEERLKGIAQKVSNVGAAEAALLPWRGFDVPVEYLSRATERSETFLAVLPTLAWSSGAGDLQEGAVSVHEVWRDASKTGCWFICAPDESERVRSVIAATGGTVVSVESAVEVAGEGANTVDDALSMLSSQRDDLAREKEQVLSDDRTMAEEVVAVLGLWDYYKDKENLAQVSNALQRTEYTCVIRGYTKAKDSDRLRSALQAHSDVAVIDEEVGPDDDPPVFLENHPLIRPFEVITNIYGYPNYDEVDPTPILAPFFWLFFGMCLGDAVYGIILALGCYWFLKTQKLAPGGDKLIRLLMYSGVSTIIVGAFFGSWLADFAGVFLTGTIVDRSVKAITLVDPIAEPLTLLVVSFLLGVLQVWVGIAVKAYSLHRAGDTKEAILSQGSWLVLIAGLMGFIASKAGLFDSPVPLWITAFGALMVVYSASRSQKNILLKPFTGLYGLYSIVSYFSDTMSYSRLLALGLASAVIGVVVNKMAALMVQLIPVVGWLLVPIVMLVGHVFNLVINVLGSFIHSGRLQFVEFFTKFFEGGGRPFKPLKRLSENVFLN